MGQAFTTSLEVINRAMQQLGADRIYTIDENSKNASEARFVYDKNREAELRRNIWPFATRRAVLRPIDVDTLLVVPPTWVSTTSYTHGSVVNYLGMYWWTDVAVTVGDVPGTSDVWQSYFGPLTAQPFDAETEWFANELVYVTDDFGRTAVYCSLSNNNENDPAVPGEWDTTVSYQLGQVVDRSGFYYLNLVPVNLGNDPLDSPVPYNAETTYAAGDTVGAIDGKIYTSVQAGNIGHPPTTDDGTWWVTDNRLLLWTSQFSAPIGNTEWTLLRDATVTNLLLGYPIGTGPLRDDTTLNVYRLPNGWLREAPQNPRQGSYSYLGVPSAPWSNAWTYEGNYLIAPYYPGPINYRFIANVTNVPRMDAMFCEGLAARIAFDLCETITQSNSKKVTLDAVYARYMSEARILGAIEVGPIEPEEDLYITCRV
tara:strand:+ start:5893 stop:7173 length:1281 start_codon:yes stop_codon:yes gene_type:complete